MKHQKHQPHHLAFKIACLAACALVGVLACTASDLIQTPQASVGSGSSGSCPGTYTAVARMTNSSGAFWITPPTGTHTGTFKDASGFGGSYSSSVTVERKSDQFTWCTNNNNSLTFPATNSSYELVVYVNSTPPPPTNNQLMTLQVTWE
jgi:hypothetical protein